MTDQLTDVDGAADGGAGGHPGGGPTVATSTSAWARWRERRRNRVTRWDRPPAPHDWRFFVGNLGKVLIGTGLLLFGFVAYQLWGTGIETARAQNRLEDAFRQQVESTATADEPTGPGFVGWQLPDELVERFGDGFDELDEADPAERETIVASVLDDVEPSELVPGGQDLSDFAVDQDVPIVPGDSFALLEIPAIGVSEYVVPGVRPTDLKRGPGHYPDTPLPGQLGNAAIAGHRTTYGAPFFDVDQLAAGDEIVVTMVTGDRFVYRITGLQVVGASDYWVVTTRDPNVAELTLTTCHPKYTARERLIVHSVLAPEQSAQVGLAEFYQDDVASPDDADTVAGDDPTVTVPADEVPAAATVPATTPDTTPDTTTDTTPDSGPDTTPDTTPDSGPAAGDTGHADDRGDLDEIDAFSQGWFDDGAAWPQIALWGLALVVISLLALRVSRTTRHDTIGILVGIGPFLVCLYFFYQNVNRLLPPGL